jgi:hypothetical protein
MNKHKTCKARFPREVSAGTQVDEATGYLILKKGEAWLNTFTPVLTYLTRCNADVTSLLSGTAIKAVIAYVTDYVTKPILKTHTMFQAVRNVFRRNTELLSGKDSQFDKARTLLVRVVNSLAAKSEIGGPMACMYLLNHPDHYTSHEFQRFYWRSYVNEVQKAWNVSNTLADSQKLPDKVVLTKSGGELVGVSAVEDYIHRPAIFEHLTLYEWVQRSNKAKISRARQDADEQEGQFLVDEILDYRHRKGKLELLIQWNHGDQTWEPYKGNERLEAVDHFLAKLGVESSDLLPEKDDNVSQNQKESEDVQRELKTDIEDDSQKVDSNENSDSAFYSDFTPEDTPLPDIGEPDEFLIWTRFSETHPQFRTHHVKLCPASKAKVPDFVGGSLPRRDKGNRDEYCMTMLTLFKPWRNGKDLKDTDESWDDQFSRYTFTDRQVDIMKYFNVRYECNDARDDYSAAQKSGKIPETMMSHLFYQSQDELDDVYFAAQEEDFLAPEVLQDMANEYLELGAKEITRLKREEAAKRLMYSSGAMEDAAHKPDLTKIQVENGQGKSKGQWDALLQAEKEAMLRQREEEAAKAKLAANLHSMEPDTVKIIDKNYLTESYPSVAAESEDLIKAVIEKFTLNEEQRRAFCIVAHHATQPKGEQLKMYLGGMAGTGKSQVIKALVHFFNERNEGYRFMCMAPTGAAAALISGSTYHSILGLGQFDKRAYGSIAKAYENLKNVDYIFMDEVSMIGCIHLYQICERMSIAMKKEDQAFGGINMIFAGDFAQLPPVAASPLYAHEVSSTTHTSKATFDQQRSIGKALWHQFTTVVILRQNMRQRSQTEHDAKFRQALENMRYKACTDDDVRLLKAHVVGSRADRPNLSDPNFHDVSIITSYNAYRNTINRLGSRRFAQETNQTLVDFYSVDKWCSANNKKGTSGRKRKYKAKNPHTPSDVIQPYIKEILWNLPHIASDNHAGKLQLCIGMPVMIRRNLATECGVTNGAEGRVVGWKAKPLDDTGRQMLDVVFVELTPPTKPMLLEGLPPNVVPIVQTDVDVICHMPNGEALDISRQQVPLLPNFGMTDFCSQGRTRPYNVCDLQNGHSIQSIYTCLSRGSTYLGTAIIQAFDGRKLQGGIKGYERQEYRDLDILDEITKLSYHRELPPSVGGVTRNQYIYSYRKWKGELFVPKTVSNHIRWTKQDPWANEDPADDLHWSIVADEKLDKTAEGATNLPKAKNHKKKQAPHLKSAKGTQILTAVSNQTPVVAKHSKKRPNQDEEGEPLPLKKKQKTAIIPKMPAKTSSENKAKSSSIIALSTSESTTMMSPGGSVNSVAVAKVSSASSTHEGPLGFRWNNNSCAYDSVFCILYQVLTTRHSVWGQYISNQNDALNVFEELFTDVRDHVHSPEYARDSMRDHLSMLDSDSL